jgi:urease accessory protein
VTLAGTDRTSTDRTSEVFAANRAQGHVSLAVAARRGGTGRSRVAEAGSLRVRFPGACAGAQEAVLVNTAGGIAGGDRLGIAVTLEAGAKLVVTTAAAEKIYRTDGPQALLAVATTLAADAELTWLPQETILFDRARFARTVDIAMAATARLVFAETVVFGRSAMGETVRDGHFADRWRVRRDGKLVFAENFRLDGAIADRLGEVAVAAGHVALGTVLMVPRDDAAVAAVRAVAGRFRGEAGISSWGSCRGGIALARLAAPDGAALRHDLVTLLSALGRAPLPRLWLN